MPTNSNELMEYAEFSRTITEFSGSQSNRTACHKAYYSCFHYFSSAFPNAVGLGRSYLKANNKSPTTHLALREGIMEISKDEKNPSKKRFLHKLSLSLGKLHSARCDADYEVNEPFTDKMAEMAVISSRKLQEDHGTKFRSN